MQRFSGRATTTSCDKLSMKDLRIPARCKRWLAILDAYEKRNVAAHEVSTTSR
jgi:hypothetical protein